MTGSKTALGSARTESAEPMALAATLAALGGPTTEPTESAPVLTGGSRFEPTSLLGEGGMGRVHVARDHQFGRDVALKELSDSASSAEGARRFVIEALVTGNLEHPGIPAVYERGTREGRPFYAMRRVEGRPMSDVIAEAKTLADRLALLPAVIQVANTLGFAHARGVVHRDVKPDNVIVAAHGEVVVVDWGIAKVRGASDVGSALSGPATSDAKDGAGANKETLHGSVLGTPAFMAPEQARGDVASIDARTDVFAVGAMMYHLFTGRPPYEGTSSMAMLAAALEGRRPALVSLAPEVPEGLRQIIDRAMATDPAARFADADELAKAISAFLTAGIVHRPSVVARVVITVATGVAVLVSAFATTMLLTQLPGLRMQGGPALAYSGLAALGMCLLLTEWLTRGRHALVPLVQAIAAATFLSGLAGTFAGLGMVSEGAGSMLSQEPPVDPRALILEGVWESCGNAAGGAQLAAFLLVLAAVVARREKPKAPGSITGA